MRIAGDYERMANHLEAIELADSANRNEVGLDLPAHSLAKSEYT
jgi:hypothetical protein